MFRSHLMRYATCESDVDNAELIFGELIANVVCHAQGPVSFGLRWQGLRPTLLVVDRGEGFRTEPNMAFTGPDAECGRGLAIVRALGIKMYCGNRPEGGAYICVVLPVERRRGAT